MASAADDFELVDEQSDEGGGGSEMTHSGYLNVHQESEESSGGHRAGAAATSRRSYWNEAATSDGSSDGSDGSGDDAFVARERQRQRRQQRQGEGAAATTATSTLTSSSTTATHTFASASASASAPALSLSSLSSSSSSSAAAAAGGGDGRGASDEQDRQSALLAEFQSFTGLQDLDQCRMLLENHNWDLNAATQTALLISDLGGSAHGFEHEQHVTASQFLRERSTSGSSYGDSAGYGNFDEPAPRGLRAGNLQRFGQNNGQVYQRQINQINTGNNNNNNNNNNHPAQNGWLSYIWWPYNLLSTTLESTLGYLGQWIPIFAAPSPYNPLTDVTNLEIQIEALYGRNHPGFFQGSYSQAVEHSKRELKFLLIYIHAPNHANTPSFCRNVLCSDAFTQFVDNTLIFWAGSLGSVEGFEVSNQLEATTYPFFALVAPLQNQAVMVDRIEGFHQADYLIARIQNVIEANGAELVSARADRQSRTVAQQLREEQDAAFTASLLADQEKEKKRQEELAKQRAIEEEEERKQRELEESAMARERERNRKRAEFAVEPSPGSGEITRIVLRLPDGQRLERRFYVSDTLQTVYDFVDIQGRYDNFSLAASYPARTFDDLSQTLAQAKLVPSAMLLVQNNDA